MKIESQLVESGRSWEDVLYIHLYLADMNNFTVANETYVKFITQEKCLFGVPSRSTIEVPLLQAGLGAAYIDVLVAKDQCKKVLHVQSISCWAPSCIGPYSQVSNEYRAILSRYLFLGGADIWHFIYHIIADDIIKFSAPSLMNIPKMMIIYS